VDLQATRRTGVWRHEALSFAKDSGTLIELPHDAPDDEDGQAERCSPDSAADGSGGRG